MWTLEPYNFVFDIFWKFFLTNNQMTGFWYVPLGEALAEGFFF